MAILAMALVIVALLILYQGGKNKNDVSIGDKFEGASLCTDIEPIASRLPWLAIQSCYWKSIFVGDGGLPGPSEKIVCGYIEVTDEYLEELKCTYEWSESDFLIHLAPAGMTAEDLKFQVSPQYAEYFTQLQKDAKIQLYVDFGNKLMYFSGTFE